MISAIAVRYRLPRPTILVAIGGAWTLALVAQAVGRAQDLHHDRLLEGGPQAWAALLLFILSWQVMLAAMMLPSSLPLIKLFDRTTDSNSARAAFLGGYAFVWTTFGLVAFAGDAMLHELVERTPFLESHPHYIGASVLAIAGLFQFSSLKDRCLDECRHPAAFLMRYYNRGTSAAFRMGRKHGIFCLGCCWALMLVAFAVGVANLAWMALLTLLMVFEKTGRNGQRGVVPIGVGLIVLAGLVAVQPPGFSALLTSLGLA